MIADWAGPKFVHSLYFMDCTKPEKSNRSLHLRLGRAGPGLAVRRQAQQVLVAGPLLPQQHLLAQRRRADTVPSKAKSSKASSTR